MNESIVGQKAAIAFEKVGGSESFGHLLHLRIGEREPNFSDFAGCKELVDEFDVRTEKSHVVHAFVVGCCCPAPHACAFDIHPDKIFVGEEFAESHAVFASSAAEFEHDGVLVFEEVTVPFPAQRVGGSVRCLERCFDYVGIGGHFGKLGELVLTHGLIVSLRRR